MPTQTNWEPLKKDEYRLYQIWKNLPISLKDPQEDIDQNKLSNLYNNTDLEKLIGITNQKEFAAQFNVEPSTLTDWNKNPVPEEYKCDWRLWAKEMTREVVAALAQRARHEGKAPEVKLFMQIVGEFTDESTIHIDGTQELFDNVKALLDGTKTDS